MGFSSYYRSSLYSIPEEEPEEKKPTRAPYRGRKSMILERPVEVKKAICVSDPVIQELKKTQNTESTCSEINLKKECDIKKEYSNNDSNIQDSKTEKILKDVQSVNQKPGSEMRKQDLNKSCNLLKQKNAQVFEYSRPFSTQTEEPRMDYPYQNNVQVYQYLGPLNIQTENVPMNIPNVNLKSGNDPLFSSQTFPDNGFYFAPPLNDASNLYYEPCDSLQQMNFVNIFAPPSTDPYCADLPFSELRTLQFFYNLGWQYFHAVNNFINYGYLQPFNSEQNPDYFPGFKNREQNQNYFPGYKKRNYNNSGYSNRTNFENQRGFRKYRPNGKNVRKKNANKNNAWNGGQRTFNRSYVYH
ncbi:uncharacterized protein LOC117169693 [Belonocnema kinseyi]|uniref:uncharacterized protein LOC117169693 n=1 Tax=Belonocnema kinseyi TaxID=2817044 RepID=UPI00143CE127|nr:uncharacterized protein LOC117169693 [Belonocnema kinseyi]